MGVGGGASLSKVTIVVREDLLLGYGTRLCSGRAKATPGLRQAIPATPGVSGLTP